LQGAVFAQQFLHLKFINLRENEILNLQYSNKVMGQLLNISEIKSLYPDEWVLLGNPIMDESKIDVLSGIPLFHSKDKKEVCYIGRDKTSNFDKITLIYTGTFRPTRKITGIFNRIKK
jgi:hypothetical protein